MKTEEEMKKKLAELQLKIKEDKDPSVAKGCLKAIAMLLIAPFLAVLNFSMLAWTIGILWGWLLAEATGFTPSFMVLFGALLVLGLSRVPQVLAVGVKENSKAGFLDLFVISIAIAFSCGVSLLIAWLGLLLFV